MENYNVVPVSSSALVVRRLQDKLKASFLKWGLVPQWMKTKAIEEANKFAYHTFNARAETLLEKASFKEAFRKRRCLVPINGFYERPLGKEKNRPHFYIRRKDQKPMALAGLWERCEGASGWIIESFSIITTEANEITASLNHPRSPVVINPENFSFWLDTGQDNLSALQRLLVPFPGKELEVYEVNKPSGNGPGCIAPSG